MEVEADRANIADVQAIVDEGISGAAAHDPLNTRGAGIPSGYPTSRRFGACVDVDGQLHDFGFTFLNLEAIYYDFATDDHAEEIMAWLDGKRIYLPFASGGS